MMNEKNFAVEFVDLTKEFDGFVANNKINLAIEKGKIFALIGENGAGKSTLMSILFGLYTPSFGYIKINGKRVEIKDPNIANDLKIGMVHQHFKLVDQFSNLENIVLGSEYHKNNFLYQKPAIEKIKLLQNKYHLHFDLHQKTGDATIGTQQKVEIIKMLYRNSEILIFDEPTAILTPQEIDGLLKTMVEFKNAGKTVIFISHKLKELKKVADAGAVIRLGNVVLKIDDFASVDLSTISKAMVGSDLISKKTSSLADHHQQNSTAAIAPTILKLENVSTKGIKFLNNISLEVKAGEILAIAGVEGNGQEEIEFVISGLLKSKHGKISFYDPETKTLKDVSKKSIQKRRIAGLSYIPSDRHKYGLVLDFSILDNTIIRRLADKFLVKYKIINKRKLQTLYQKIAKKYDVRGGKDGYAIARSLSGGNQQKAIVGRELISPHQILLICQPTRGLDIGAIENIHQAILEEKAQQKAILLISYELDEVLALADNVAVINKGHLSNKIPIDQIDRHQIGLMMAGIAKE
ncbi:ABC transporter, ATP-binding protein (cluster 11, riboflavin/purine nucleoside) [[Mycoplasma] cavipharyngis]|uniref:ABC transporter ATP-binding protein n=1 Tax=[Mycoplasma] cavipharyngis TaxID=92757 RepID=UPI0037042E9C